MAAEKGSETGPSTSSSKTVEELEQLELTLEETLGLASADFDPMRIIYAPSLDIEHEHFQVYDSVSLLMESVQLDIEELQEENLAVNIGELQEENITVNIGELQEENLTVNIGEIQDSTHGGGDHDHGHDGEKIPQSSSAAAIKPESSPSHEFTKQTPAVDCINTDVVENTADIVAAESVSKPEEKEPQCETESKPPEISEELGNKNEKKAQSCRLRSQAKKNVLTQMKDGFVRGPLNILKRSVQEKLKVRVWTRNVRNIRGVSTGYVIAFDKHLNLAMIDVDEVYRKSNGRRHKKKKQPEDDAAPPAESSQTSEEAGEALYPKTPWKTISRQAGGLRTEADGAAKCPEDMNWDDDNSEDNDDNHGRVFVNPPADGIGNLTSRFSGMHMFDENETSRLLGVKSKNLLTRHLNQVLLRGENVVAVSLVELNL